VVLSILYYYTKKYFFSAKNPNKSVGKSKEEAQREKRLELEKKLIDVSGQLSGNTTVKDMKARGKKGKQII